jgi:two-component system CheB/CheR fusion protein
VNPEVALDVTDDRLEELLLFIRDARGFDFTGYKRSSLARRIRKRMNDVGIGDYADYRDLLETDAAEFSALFNTILINVTGLLRDPDCWSYLKGDVIPELLATSGDAEIRVWSAGCSSGEEPYSVAMMFAEVLGIEECARRVKIYGTDVDEDALRQARTGQYPAKSVASVPTDLRDRYFEANGDSYTFRSDLRRRVIFGRHDITRDAPISRLDLLVCRNTLMYFNVETQAQIIDRFHYALRERGYLFLGKAEMLLSDSNRFEVTSIRQRIFRRRADEPGVHRYPAPPLDPAGAHSLPDASRRRQLRDLTLEAAPNAVILVDAGGSISMFNDQARDMFRFTARDLNRPFHDLDFSYRPVELRSLMERAEHERHHVRVTGAERRQPNGELQYLDVLVQPLFDSGSRSVGMAVTFVDTTEAVRLLHEVERVRQDLERAYEALQSTNEELETTNEELQSSIEELETTNEELQSTNEELETTNEELESGNEELETMNEEMRIRSLELEEARTFLAGVLASIVAGVVVLDAQLRVRSWNRGAEDLWGLRGQEVIKEPFFGLDFGLAVADLRAVVEDCRASRHRTEPVTLAAVNRIGRTISCSVTCSPLDDHSDGVVLLMEELHPG